MLYLGVYKLPPVPFASQIVNSQKIDKAFTFDNQNEVDDDYQVFDVTGAPEEQKEVVKSKTQVDSKKKQIDDLNKSHGSADTNKASKDIIGNPKKTPVLVTVKRTRVKTAENQKREYRSSLQIWDIRTGDLIKTLNESGHFIKGLTKTFDNKIVTVGNDSSVNLYY